MSASAHINIVGLSSMFTNKEEALQSQAEKFHMTSRLYHNAFFIGSEAVKVIIDLKLASNEQEAIDLGNKWMNANLIRHINNDEKFKKERLYYCFTDRFYQQKKRNTQHLTPLTTPMGQKSPCSQKRKVSFLLDPAGFAYSTPSNEGSILSIPQDEDDKSWNKFGSLSKSEFSFVSDRSSFAASLNTLSDANLWILDPEQEKDQKLDFTKDENNNIQGFTFGGNKGDEPTFGNHISNETRKRSITSPALYSKHSQASHSITFSSTVSLYTDTEKRQNSLLFFDLWGVPANIAPATSETVVDEDTLSGLDLPKQITPAVSGSSVAFSRQPSTMLRGPSDLAEDWSDFGPDFGHEMLDEQEEQEYSEDLPQTKLKYTYAKRTSTANFIFGKSAKNT